MLRAEFLLVRLPLSPLALTLSPMYSSVRRPQLVAAHRGTCSHFLWLWGHEYCKAWETAAEPGGLSMLISLCNTMPNNMSLVQTSHKMLVLLRQHGKHLNHRTASGQNGEGDGQKLSALLFQSDKSKRNQCCSSSATWPEICSAIAQDN